MAPSHISQTTAPFCPGVAGCPDFAANVLLPIEAIALVAAGVVTGLTDREGLFASVEAVERGRGVMEILGCWLALTLLTAGVVEL